MHPIIFVSFFSTLSLVLYLTVSFILASKIKGSDILRKIYLIPILLSSVAIAKLWIKAYNPSNSILNAILTNLGVTNPPSCWVKYCTVCNFHPDFMAICRFLYFNLYSCFSRPRAIPNELTQREFRLGKIQINDPMAFLFFDLVLE